MSLKAVLFDFNGTIINDELIHLKLIEQMLIEENLRPNPEEYREVCLGRSDRVALTELLTRQGRVVSEAYLTQLMTRKAQAYQRYLETLETLPIYPGVENLLAKLRDAEIKLAVVSGALHSEIELVLNRLQLSDYFATIVAGDDLTVSKPEPDGYLLAVERLNQLYPGFNLQPSECLAIEDTLAGIQAAKGAGMPVVGVANTYPFHILQRQANWTVDYLADLDLEQVQQVFSLGSRQQIVNQC